MDNSFRQRVIAEKAELDERLVRLAAFIDTTATYKALPREEQERLSIQRHLMGALSGVLGARIAAFPQEHKNG